MEAATKTHLFTAFDVTVAGCGQLLCEIQLMHVKIWNVLQESLSPTDVCKIQKIGYLASPLPKIPRKSTFTVGRATKFEDSTKFVNTGTKKSVNTQFDNGKSFLHSLTHTKGEVAIDRSLQDRCNSLSPRARLKQAKVTNELIFYFVSITLSAQVMHHNIGDR